MLPPLEEFNFEAAMALVLSQLVRIPMPIPMPRSSQLEPKAKIVRWLEMGLVKSMLKLLLFIKYLQTILQGPFEFRSGARLGTLASIEISKCGGRTPAPSGQAGIWSPGLRKIALAVHRTGRY